MVCSGVLANLELGERSVVLIPSLPVPTLLSHPLPFPPLPSLPLEVAPVNQARGVGSAVSSLLGLGRSTSRNRILCILALKFDIWWQQF